MSGRSRREAQLVSPSAAGPNTAPSKTRVPVSTSVINSTAG
ncbi:hypothetical protein [Streptomyces tsukubensis]|nr:hypothetical protein [Streptomyces tsukubensis]